jgi:hypothetical protein
VPDLRDGSEIQHHDPVGERHRLDLVMGHVDHGRRQVLVQLGDLVAHFHAQRGVEVRQGLVEQEGRRVAHDGPPDRHPLPLTAAEVLGPPFQVRLQPQHPRGLGHLGLLLGLRRAGGLQREPHVLATDMCG